jgi:hypothetical protein
MPERSVIWTIVGILLIIVLAFLLFNMIDDNDVDAAAAVASTIMGMIR